MVHCLGRIESTDVIYKHKLQIQMEGETEGGDEALLTPATPIETPQVPHGVAADVPESEEEQEASS